MWKSTSYKCLDSFNSSKWFRIFTTDPKLLGNVRLMIWRNAREKVKNLSRAWIVSSVHLCPVTRSPTLADGCRQCSRSLPDGSSVKRANPDSWGFLIPILWFSVWRNSSTVVEPSKPTTSRRRTWHETRCLFEHNQDPRALKIIYVHIDVSSK